MKAMLFVFLIFLQLSTNAQSVKRCDIRNEFQNCNDEEQTGKLASKLESIKNPEPIHIGYRGAITASKARFSNNPFKKYSYCKSGLAELNAAIEKTPNDVELRYLRLVIQSNVPSFLGMNDKISEDKSKILAVWHLEKDENLKKMIAAFLLKSDLCTESEKKLLASN